MTTTIPSATGTGRELVIQFNPKLIMFRVDAPGAPSQRPVTVDRVELGAALAKEARFTIIDNDDLPEVNGFGRVKTTFGAGMAGWMPSDLTHEMAIERARELIQAYSAVLLWHEERLAEEQAKAPELDAIERFIAEHNGTPTAHLVHALHEKGFRVDG